MTMTATMNGRPRKQLSDQLDRLDDILDVLADALPAAVADAVKEGARQAVKDAVLEVLANPELRALLARPVAETIPSTPPKVSVWSRMKAKLADLRQRAAALVRPMIRRVVEKSRAAAPALAASAYAFRWVWRLRQPMMIAAVVGLIVGILSYLAPHAVSAAIGGAGGMCAALAVRGGLWVRAAARRVGLV